MYKKRNKIEAMGIEYDEEALAAGEYDEMLIGGRSGKSKPERLSAPPCHRG